MNTKSPRGNKIQDKFNYKLQPCLIDHLKIANQKCVIESSVPLSLLEIYWHISGV